MESLWRIVVAGGGSVCLGDSDWPELRVWEPAANASENGDGTAPTPGFHWITLCLALTIALISLMQKESERKEGNPSE